MDIRSRHHSNPDAEHLNRYALCLTHRDMKVLREFLNHAEVQYRLGKIKIEPGIGQKGVSNAINKFKQAKAI